MFNMFYDLKKRKDNEKLAKDMEIKNHYDDLKVKFNAKREKMFEHRVKHFTHDYAQILTKVSNSIEFTRKQIKKSLMSQSKKLTDNEAERRIEIGVFKKENVKKYKDGMIKNELNKYITGNSKKTYFKSFENVFLDSLFSLKNKEDKLLSSVNERQVAKEFVASAKINPKPYKLNTENFNIPKHLLTEKHLKHENLAQYIKDVKKLIK